MNKKTHIKKQPVLKALPEKTEEANVSVEQETPSEQPQPIREKSILKPLLFFAIFALCIEAAVLYPFLTQQPEPLVNITPKAPALVLDSQPALVYPPQAEEPSSVAEQEQTAPDCLCECETPTCIDSKMAEQLQARIHELEIENLSLKEQNSLAAQNTSLIVDLLTRIYIGQPFEKQLNDLNKYDKKNPLGTIIQNHFGIYSRTGIPVDTKIAQIFESKFQAAIDSYYLQDQQRTFLSTAKSFVRVYPEHLTSANAEGIGWLYLARQQVAHNDFKAAIQSIEHLPKQTAELFNDFIAAANARDAVQNMITSDILRKEIK